MENNKFFAPLRAGVIQSIINQSLPRPNAGASWFLSLSKDEPLAVGNWDPRDGIARPGAILQVRRTETSGVRYDTQRSERWVSL
jgi:hypothetical protein